MPSARLPWSGRPYLTPHGHEARLTALPFFGPFKAKQVYELLTSGTCEALSKFQAGMPPTDLAIDLSRPVSGLHLEDRSTLIVAPGPGGVQLMPFTAAGGRRRDLGCDAELAASAAAFILACCSRKLKNV